MLMVGWMDGWLVGWMVGLLVAWFVDVPVAGNPAQHARSWRSTHKFSNLIQGISTEHYQKNVLCRYQVVGDQHFIGVHKWNLGTDGTKLATKDLDTMLFVARRQVTLLIRAMWGPPQVPFGKPPDPFHPFPGPFKYGFSTFSIS